MAVTHRGAVLLMVVVTLLWSIAGVVARQLDSARGFELTFWRSSFNALALIVILGAWRGPRALAVSIASGGRALWLSGLCWCTMYTAFMVALTLTTVANVLVTLALAPLFTALVARVWLRQRLPARTWAAIALAGAGIGWMYGHELQSGSALIGTAVALAVPVAAAVNWTLIQSLRGAAAARDMLPSILLGALLSAAITLPLAWPTAASAHDVAWLALLGVVQLAVPCVLSVLAARVLPAPQVALLALLEVIFGTLWAWWGAGEAPSNAALAGGLVVLLALAGNEVLAMRERALE